MAPVSQLKVTGMAARLKAPMTDWLDMWGPFPFPQTLEMLVLTCFSFLFVGGKLVCGRKEGMGQLKAADQDASPVNCKKVSCPECDTDSPQGYQIHNTICLSF